MAVSPLGDGVVVGSAIWLRVCSHPAPRTRSALAAMAVSPLGDSVVVGSAAGGLFAVDLVGGACAVSPLAAAPLPGPVAALAWNARTGEVLAAAQACVCVFRPAH
jgi:hypothetical protein